MERAFLRSDRVVPLDVDGVEWVTVAEEEGVPDAGDGPPSLPLPAPGGVLMVTDTWMLMGFSGVPLADGDDEDDVDKCKPENGQ